MKRIIFICFILLAPALAMQYGSSQQEQSRLQKGTQEIWALEEQVKILIHSKEDTFFLEKEEIKKQRSYLPTGNGFEKEMAPLLEILLPPEALLSEEQRRGLLSFPPNLENLQPLDDIITRLDGFINKWKGSAQDAEALQLASLTKLLEEYQKFKKQYLCHISNAYDILTPKAQFKCLCEPHPGLVSQTMACKVSCIKHDGWFCFNEKNKKGQFEKEAQLKGKGNVFFYTDGNLTFTIKDTEHPFHIGRDRLLYWLESFLLGIDSNPMTFGIFDGIRYLEPNTPQKIAKSELVKKYLEKPEDWHEQSISTFVQIELNHKSGFLREVLEDIAMGHNSFDCLDVNSFGQQMLASILLKRPMTFENSGVEEKNGKLGLKRVGPGEMFHPSFHLLENGQHWFIGADISFFLPFANQKISQEVKKKYLSNNIKTILCHFLTKAKELERCFNDICVHYNLNTKAELGECLRTDVTQAHVLGLVALTRPGLVNHLLETDAKIRQLLEGDITYLQLLEAVYLEDYHCHKWLEEAVRRKAQAEAFRVLLDDIIPSKIRQLKESQATEYSSEDLRVFEYSRSVCRLTHNVEVSEGRPFLFDKAVSELKSLEGQQFIQKCYVDLFQWAFEKNTTVTFFGEILPSIINQLKDIDFKSRRVGGKSFYSLEELVLLEKEAQACLMKAEANEATSFKDLLSTVSSTAAAFFQEKFDWWQVENGGLKARHILDIWVVASGEHKSTYENLRPETVSSLPLWEKIPLRTGREYSAPTFSNLLESNYPVDDMINDFIQRMDLSSLPQDTVMATDFGFGLPLSEIVLRRRLSWPIALTKKHVSDFWCLRQYLPPDISKWCMWLNCGKHELTISGTRGNTALLCRLISLFPGINSLSIRNNGLRSLKPLVTTLSGLSNLTCLDVSENPIHNPEPLGAFPNLCTLIMNNTCIPALGLPALKRLISPAAKMPPLNNVTEYVINHTIGDYEVRQNLLKSNDSRTLWQIMEKYLLADDLTPTEEDTMICILEQLSSEKNWNDTLENYCAQSHLSSFQALPWDKLFDLFEQHYDPIDLARKLIFALKFGFPAGTLPLKLSFENGLPTKESNSLTCLAISSVPVGKNLLSSLTQFRKMTHLYLCGTGNPSILKDLPLLTHLRFLDVTGNKIFSLQGLHTIEGEIKFPNLQGLILKNNSLTNKSEARLNYIRELQQLIRLNLAYNQLTKDPNLGTIKGLSPDNPYAQLDVSNNRIEEFHTRMNGIHFTYSPQITPTNSPSITPYNTPKNSPQGSRKQEKK